MVSGAEPYLVGFSWDLVMGCYGPDWRVGPLWVPKAIKIHCRTATEIGAVPRVRISLCRVEAEIVSDTTEDIEDLVSVYEAGSLPLGHSEIELDLRRDLKKIERDEKGQVNLESCSTLVFSVARTRGATSRGEVKTFEETDSISLSDYNKQLFALYEDAFKLQGSYRKGCHLLFGLG